MAGGEPCCCQTPACVCTDYCPYIIEITAPSAVAVRSPVGTCDGAPAVAEGQDDSWLVWMVAPPAGLGLSVRTMTGGSPQTTNWSVLNSVLVSGLSAGVGVMADYTNGDEFDPTITRVEISVGMSLYCEVEPPGNYATRPVLLAGITVVITQWRSGQWAPFLGLSSCNVSKSIAFYPATECQYNNARTCSYTPLGLGPGAYRYIQTPLTLNVSASTTSAEPWGTDTSASGGSLGTTLLGWANDIVDGISATFRITSRGNCLPPVECDCQTNLQGTQWLFSQGDLTRDCDWNTTAQDGDKSFQEWGSSPFYIYWDGGGSFFLERFDSGDYVAGIGGLVTERHTTEFGCTTIDGVPTWTVTITSECIQYNNVPNQTHRSIDTWVGRLLCYESCEDNYHAAGVPLPTGELVDVEYIGRWTETGYSECTPPARLAVSGRQIVAPC